MGVFMKIAIVTHWYNEEDLAPFFLKLYSYVDKIFLFLDVDTGDNTRSICENYDNVEIIDFCFPEGFDDYLKVDHVNEFVKTLANKFDWVYAIDSDEFIFPPRGYNSAKEFLAKQNSFNMVRAKMFQVYKHVTDEDLDVSRPVLTQRVHGDPDLTSHPNWTYCKPVIVRPEAGIEWNPGFHTNIEGTHIREAKEHFWGAHWANVDLDIAIERQIYGRKARLSPRQIRTGATIQHIHVTEEKIRNRFEKHKNDPDVLSRLLPEYLK